MKRLLPVSLLFIVLAIGCGGGLYWWQIGRYVEMTDNAYIRGDIIPISSKVSGYVEQVTVADNQEVASGDILLRIEELEYRVRLERGENLLTERQSALLVATEKRKRQRSMIDLTKAQLEVARVELVRETEEFKRLKKLHVEKIISELEFDKAIARKNRCRAEMQAAEANLEMAKQELVVMAAEEQQLGAEIEQQRATLKLLRQEVADTVIGAPLAGTVGNRRVRVGQYVRPGSILMALIPLQNVWVEANFKEVQLARMQVGQSVEIEVDAYPKQKFTGWVESFSPASGAEFSILPPENATGNFTKIVQRIPVRIGIDMSSQVEKLRPGMSVEVRLDTRRSVEKSARLAEK